MYKLSAISRVLLFASAVLIAVSIKYPIWKIDLIAPQYPEGLALLIYSNELAGDVEIINGLNHYIGMKTLHTEDFVEFTILPYIFGAFSLILLLIAVLGKEKFFHWFLIGFILFGLIALADFYRWNYNYGHDLDPTAAIIVPGMAYQPPVLGYKQLLNFGAYSFPTTGGYMFIGGGVLMLVVAFLQWRKRKKQAVVIPAAALLLLLSFASCTKPGPDPLKVNVDLCEHCKMTIADPKFGAELITKKGRIYKFDDVNCMEWYAAENPSSGGGDKYVADYLAPNQLISVSDAIFISGKEVRSPMGGNIAAFSNADSAKAFGAKLGAIELYWKDVNF